MSRSALARAAALFAFFTAFLTFSVSAQDRVKTIPVKTKPIKEAPYPTRVETDGGITVETQDGRLSFVLDGRLQFDTLFYDGIYNNAAGGAGASDTRVRRMRLGVGGKFDQDWAWNIIYDINDDSGKATLHTGSFTYSGLPWTDLTVGRFKRPFFLEAVTSSNWIPLVERSLINDVVRRNIADFGLMASRLYRLDELGDLSWYLSLANEGVEDYAGAENAAGRDQYQIYSRVAWAPWNEKGKVLHFGAALGDLNPARGSNIAIETKLGVSAANTLGFTYKVEEDRQAGLEAAFIWGPFSAQSEYVLRSLDLVGGGSADISGGYLQATYTITGESRRYNPYPARMDKLVPGDGRFGAVELAARYDDIELERPAAASAQANLLTLGVNWYFNRHMHLKLNYLMADGDNFGVTQTEGDAVTSRLAFVF